MDTRQLDARLAVREQVQPAALAEAARLGFAAVINNRPDGEEPGQPTSAQIAAAAAEAGLAYRHIPVVPGQISDEQIAAFADALDELPQPILGFCRTGTRSTTLWALANARALGADHVIKAAAKAGYDLEALRPRLAAQAG